MSVVAFLRNLVRRGIQLDGRGRKIRFRAPAGAFTQELKALVIRRRRKVFRLLRRQEAILDRISEIEVQAFELGWTFEQLWRRGSMRPDESGLAEILRSNQRISRVSREFIELEVQDAGGFHNLKFYNLSVPQPWLVAVDIAPQSAAPTTAPNTASTTAPTTSSPFAPQDITKTGPAPKNAVDTPTEEAGASNPNRVSDSGDGGQS